MDKYLVIALGGGLGACARYGLSVWAAQRLGPAFPYGTLLINVSGSFLLGLFLTVSAHWAGFDPRWRLFVAVGFLGGYTTFSTFAFDSTELLLAGKWGAGLGNLLGNNVLGLAAAALGIGLGQRL
jgi:fluoride exporter